MRRSPQTPQTPQTGLTPQSRLSDSFVQRESRRFKAWLAERLVSTAPVTTWPPDELDYYGGTAPSPKPTPSRTKRRKGAR